MNRISRASLVASVLLLLFVLACVWLVFRYVESEQARDLQNWQQRLGVIAESQKRGIDAMLEKQVGQLQTLATNPLVQIALAESLLADEQATADSEQRRGQFHHLKNLLDATVTAAGVFHPLQAQNNNRAHDINDGIALYSRKRLLLASRYFPLQDAKVKQWLAQVVEQKQVSVSPLYRNAAGQARYLIAAPVAPVQSLGAARYNGAVIAVIDPARALYPAIRRHWLTTRTDETLLARREGESVIYTSPLAEPFPLFYTQPLSATHLAVVYGVGHVGGFARKQDYRGHEVLVTSRRIQPGGWILVQKIDTDEALAESRAHQRFILIILLLFVFFIAVTFIAIWRHATSVHLQKAMNRLAERTALLNAVGDSIRDSIFLLDGKRKLVMLNQALADFLGVRATDVIGRSLYHLYERDTADRLLALLEEDEVRNRELRLPVKGRRYDYHATVVPLRNEKYRHTHLFVLHDITELKDAQGRHNRMMEAVIRTLVRLTDIHDPHCACHSERTAEVAVAIARAMGLEQKAIGALSMAALLANVGKLYVPREILLREGELSAEEKAELRKSTGYTLDILRQLRFEGPVLRIVEQKNERLDGGGYPAGLKGEAIMLEARILAVANAFVAMLSARAWREGKPLEEVLDTLFAQADSHYDRKVVSTLLYVAENRNDWRNWSKGCDLPDNGQAPVM